MEVYELSISFEESGLDGRLVRVVKGESILDALLDAGIEIHHNCGGVCACSTCHIYVEDGMENLPEISEKEEDFIDRAINPRLESRLACQCEVSGNVKVKIPNQSVLIGH